MKHFRPVYVYYSMTEPVKNLYKEGKANKVFLNELLAADPSARKPKWHWSDVEKALYAEIYMGWLIAKGLYNEENYK